MQRTAEQIIVDFLGGSLRNTLQFFAVKNIIYCKLNNIDSYSFIILGETPQINRIGQIHILFFSRLLFQNLKKSLENRPSSFSCALKFLSYGINSPKELSVLKYSTAFLLDQTNHEKRSMSCEI